MTAEVETGHHGKKNIYVCWNCQDRIITVDRDRGVTPFMIDCTSPGCGGLMASSLYRLFNGHELRADHEWYRPEPSQALAPFEEQHVKNGGLLLRKIK
jgi:hypothetical protein